MTRPPGEEAEAACLASLEAALGDGRLPELGAVAPAVLERALRSLARDGGPAAMSLLRSLADLAPDKAQRKAARRVIYRLSQAGVAVPPASVPAPRPVVRRETEKPARAWLSSIDGSGSRAAWVLFEEGGAAGLRLCSLVLNDRAGILEASGGPISRKALDRQLERLREHEALAWMETEPARAGALVREALALHARAGTEPAPGFSRWRPLFDALPPAPEPASGQGSAGDPDPALLERCAEVLTQPDLGGWCVDPAAVQEDALALLQARESRLLVSDQVKAEREAAIVDAVIERELTPEARQRWARRLAETALVFRATGREEPARLAEAAGAALAGEARPARAIPLARALALRGLALAADVALGRARLSDVSHQASPHPPR
jgi:hypothetical protein